MGVETYPSRESGSQREVRQAVGRQLTRIVLFCALSLVAGIGIGQYFVRQQLEVQQGVVGQLQREIRGLTGDIQRLEHSNAHSITRCEQIVSRLESAQRGELSSEFQCTQHRLESLERLVQRQVDETQQAQAACLAEFEPYRRKHLAVPVDLIAEALDRLIAGRTDDLRVLVDEIRSHAELQRSRLAALHGGALLGSTAGEGVAPSTASLLLQPLPTIAGSPEASILAELGAYDFADRADSTTIRQSQASQGADVPMTLALPEGAVNVADATTDANDIEPIPDATVPSPRAMIGPPGRRRPFSKLLCFASGRQVETPVPVRRGSLTMEPDSPERSASADDAAELR